MTREMPARSCTVGTWCSTIAPMTVANIGSSASMSANVARGILVDVIGNDPSARSALQNLVPRSREINEAITTALTGPRPDSASTVRAHAAYAAAKNGTLALLAANGGHLSPAERAALLAAAVRALTEPRARAVRSRSSTSRGFGDG